MAGAVASFSALPHREEVAVALDIGRSGDALGLRPVTGPEGVQIWAFDLDRPPNDRAALTALLSKQELDRAAEFATERDRDRYTVGRGILRSLLGRLSETPPAELVLGVEPGSSKPRLVSPRGFVFNLSHSDDVGLIAAARTPTIRALGVDLELLRSDAAIDALAQRLFSPAEQRELQQLRVRSYRVKSFFDCWCRKEAIVKGLGTGLDLPLADFDVQVRSAAPAPVSGRGETHSRVTGWVVYPLYIAERFSAALAVLR